MKTIIYKEAKIILTIMSIGLCLLVMPQCKADDPDQIIDDFSSTLALIKQYDYGKSHAWLEDFQNIMVRVYNNPQSYEKIESLMIETLGSEISIAAKQMICSYLGSIASAKAISVLEKMLLDDQLSASALQVLQKIPDPAVDHTLLEALSETDGLTKVGVINVIALRKDKKSVNALSALIFDRDILLSKSAIFALGNIGSDQALKSLEKAFTKSESRIKVEISEALLICADNLSDTEADKALSIYQEVFNAQLQPSIKYAALKGILEYDYEKGKSLIIELLLSNDPDLQMLVMPLIRDLDENADMAEFLNVLPKLGEYQQMQLFSAIADRNDQSVKEVVKNAVYHDNLDIQLAALMALRNIATTEDIEFLAKVASETKSRHRDMARECLAILKGKDIDQKIISGLENPEPKIRVEFVRSIGERNLTSGVEAVMKTLNDPDRKVRLESYKVLGKLAGPDELEEIIDISLKAKSSAERKEAERTLTLISLKIQDKDQQVKEILAVLPDVKDNASLVMLIQALGNIGNERALPVILDYLEYESTEIQIAAIKALSVWPDAAPLKDLRTIVESSNDIKVHNLAMRGYVRMIQIEDQMTEDQKGDECKHAFELAKNLEEQKIIVSGLSAIQSRKTFQMALDLLGNPDLKSEAEAAIARIAGPMGNKDPVYVRTELNKLIGTTDNLEFKARLQEILKWMDD